MSSLPVNIKVKIGPEPQLEMERIEYPVIYWVGFCQEIGPDVMRTAYGWDSPPSTARADEIVFGFHLPGEGTQSFVGWVSLIGTPQDQSDVWLALGVRPRYQNKGYRKQMLDLASAWAFRELKAQQITMLVYDTNPRHAEQCMREWEKGKSPWVYSGRAWYPVGFRTFTYMRPEEKA